MSLRRLVLIAGVILLGATIYRVGSSSADEWLPISPEELKMTSDAAAPGAPAIILYRQVDRDDSNARIPHEYNYVREKIFTEEGRKNADVEIPFVKGDYNIINIRARTVRQDGSSVVYDGKIYEKEIVKARGFKYLAKTFTLSDVQPGSIIEYHYTIDFAEDKVFDSNWILSSDLFTKSAKFTLAGNVEDVLKRGYGYGDDITLLFLGLARAAGMEASAARISTREDHFFFKNLMKARDLRTYVVLVKLNGKDVYFDPGTAFAPFGLLPWSESWTSGLRLDKDGGEWITTSMPQSRDSQIERKADLKLTQEGSLEGKLKVTYSGLEAMYRRMEQRNEDEAQRRKSLEDDVRYMIPASIEVTLANKPDWSSSDPNLVAEFDLKVTGWAAGAGRRALMAVGIFSAQEKHMCEHATRVHPMYFHYASEKVDNVTIELPLGWQVSSVPKPENNDAKVMLYTMKVENNNGTLHVERRMKSDLITLDQKFYPALRKFYDVVRTSDEEQIVLQPASTAAGN